MPSERPNAPKPPTVPDPTPGLYPGGHARIEVPSGGTQKIVWRAAEAFEISFEELKSNKGNGGGKPGVAQVASTAVTQGAGGTYSYEVTLAKGNGTRKSLSSKYSLKFASSPYILDPVIIVDR